MSTAILNFATQFTLYSGYFLFSFGIVGNIINIFVFTRFKLFRSNSCAFYLTVEAFSNLLYVLLTITVTLFTTVYGDDGTGRFLLWCKARYTWNQLSVLITYCMICCSAVDQFLSTNYRLYRRQMCTIKLARIVAFIAISFLIMHAVAFGYFFQIQLSVGCVIWNPIYLQYATFFLYPIFGGLMPIATTSLFSLLAYRNVRRIVRRQLPIVRRRLDRQMTAMVLVRVLLFICLASPFSFFRVYVINSPVSRSQQTEFAIRQLLQALFLFSINLNYIVIYFCDSECI